MSENQPFDREHLDSQVRRLREEVAAGNLDQRQDLVESLMFLAQIRATDRDFDNSVPLIDEAIGILQQLVAGGGVEFRTAVGRCMLFRAINIRFRDGEQKAIVAFDETIQYLNEIIADGVQGAENELAVTLMNKADILNEPLGAHSAAIGLQEQAIRIWERLVEIGDGNFRGQLVAALIARADSRMLSGDKGAAIADYQYAVDFLHDEIEHGDLELREQLVRLLSKMSKLYEQRGDVAQSFETSSEAIKLVHTLIDEGDESVMAFLTAFHLQRGMLFERLNDGESALAEYDRCRDVFLELIRQREFGEPGEYFIRTGLANVLMCRGNMLTDRKQFDEAKAAFDEAIQNYRHATEFRSDDDDDETFIPYSIAVVQLNCANMLVAQGKLVEAVALQEIAIQTLHQRMNAGHAEIFPNVLSAYRKMVNVQHILGDRQKQFLFADKLIALAEKAVDDGMLEYRFDLANTYHLRGICFDEIRDNENALKDYRKAMRLFREIADDETNEPESPVARVVWGEVLRQIANNLASQGKIDDGIAEFQRVLDDLAAYRAEGNEQADNDISLTLTHFSDFLSEALQRESDRRETDDYHRWEKLAQETATRGLEFSNKVVAERQAKSSDGSIDEDHAAKIAFFHQKRGEAFSIRKEIDGAIEEFKLAADAWEKLLRYAEKERLIVEYNAKEAAAVAAEHAETDEILPPSVHPEMSDMLPRLLHYLGEFRRSLQAVARYDTEQRKYDEALEPLQRDLATCRRLLRIGGNGVENLLVLSLHATAEGLDRADRLDEAAERFDEMYSLLRQRAESAVLGTVDVALLKHGSCAYAFWFAKHDKTDRAGAVMDSFVATLDGLLEFPPPGDWISACHGLDAYGVWTNGEELTQHRQKQQELLAKHPEFATNDDLKERYQKLAQEPEPSFPDATPEV